VQFAPKRRVGGKASAKIVNFYTFSLVKSLYICYKYIYRYAYLYIFVIYTIIIKSLYIFNVKGKTSMLRILIEK